jgi:hypothetical protein
MSGASKGCCDMRRALRWRRNDYRSCRIGGLYID